MLTALAENQVGVPFLNSLSTWHMRGAHTYTEAKHPYTVSQKKCLRKAFCGGKCLRLAVKDGEAFCKKRKEGLKASLCGLILALRSLRQQSKSQASLGRLLVRPCLQTRLDKARTRKAESNSRFTPRQREGKDNRNNHTLW